MENLTEKERIEILMMIGYGDRRRSYAEVCNLFNATYPNRNPINKSTVCKTLRRFNHTGSVKNLGKSGRPKTVTNDENALNLMLDVVNNPKTSLTQLAANHDMCKQSAFKILKNQKFHPYKVRLVQELNDDDFDRRLQFCETIMDRMNHDPNFVNNIVFTDEATFYLHGEVNRQNCRYWSDSNPRWMEESHTQFPKKINVWAGM